jgi:phosphatidylinositol alpha-1,6-mannosyltransferase
VGGIQSYLWELWRRLPPDAFAVVTVGHPGDQAFDEAQAFRVERVPVPMLLPTPSLARRVRRVAAEVGAGLVVLDPALPVGLLGPHLGLPYAVILHGAEVSVPGRLPLTRQALARVLGRAELAVAGGRWAEQEARRVAGGAMPPVVTVTPGVDHHRFRPVPAREARATRSAWGLPPDGRLVLSVSRLVPRKGMATLVQAAARLAPAHPDVTVAIAGTGREEAGLVSATARSGAPVRLLGRVTEADLPSLYAAADVFVMACRTRWAGLEQEGFGIVFLEAAASGVPAVAGDSGGASEAVVHGETGLVLARPGDPAALAAVLERLLDDAGVRTRLGHQARCRIETNFTYEVLASRLARALEA